MAEVKTSLPALPRYAPHLPLTFGESTMSCRATALCFVALLLITGRCGAQATVHSVQPRTCKPGQTTRLTLHGKDLDKSLKIIASTPTVDVHVERIEPTQAIVDLRLPGHHPLGPLGLWIADSGGPLKPLVVMVDDLDAVTDQGDNHSLESAQQVFTSCAVDGVCDGSQSDFYRITTTEAQRIAFEVQTQPLHSAMDPVLRLLDARGNRLHRADDDAVGPDCRFSYQFAAGEYWLEVHDSRHSASGEAYHLRIGDFPIVSHGYPLAIRTGEKAKIEFAGPDSSHVAAREVEIPAEFTGDSLNVDVRMDGGSSSAWISVLASDSIQFTEPQFTETEAGQATQPEEPLPIPIGISGRLRSPGERDSYRIRGSKDQRIRVASLTRSLGCPTMLQMQLFDSAGSKVAETKVTKADEWSFDYVFPADGEYRLEVADLLKRGGEELSYWVGISPAGTFSIALKADAKTPEQFAIQPGHGACAIDLQIARFGYEGAIELSLDDEIEGLRILNPRIAAKSKEARVYLLADSNWNDDSVEVMRLVATATDDPNISCRIGSRALQRAKKPFILFPAEWADGAIVLGGVAASGSPFALEPAEQAIFARPLKKHSATLSLKRTEKEFKQAVRVLGNGLPPGWDVSVKVDQDKYTATFSQSEPSVDPPEQLSLLVYGEFQGRGRIESVDLPVQWFDPLKVTLELPEPLIAGGRATVRAKIVRGGTDSQPVVLKLSNPPPGLAGPETVTVPADASQVDFQLQISPDVQLDGESELSLVASSKYGESDFTVHSSSVPLNLVAGPQRLEVYPDKIALAGLKDKRQLVVTGFDSAEALRDWTHEARITSMNPAIAEVRGGVVHPKSDGQTDILVEVGGLQQTVPLQVSDVNSQHPIAFESEVLVALSKQGCNSGACHGSPSGKGGFRLSLRAFDRRLDELTLIREDFGRRVNTLAPERSLLLLKPLMKVSHGGGKQLHKEDLAYQLLRDWIAEGAQADPADTPRCVRLEVFPGEKRVLEAASRGQQLAATAHFADGTEQDVTHLVAYDSSNTSVATVDEHGFVTPRERGETVILVRYLEHIESVPLMFVENLENFQWQAPTPNNYVDRLVNAKLRQLQYLPSQTCTDAEFLRRVYLDVVGILPTVEETKEFLEDDRTDKRTILIDRLLEREEYAKFWALKWGDLLKMTSKTVGDEGVYKYQRWVEEALHDNMPYDEFARQLLTGAGSTLANPPANFYRTSTDMNECVETISQVFLGARLQCAKCHNHPFERWTQDNYYGLGAFFHRVERRQTGRPGEMFIYTSFSGEVTQPRTGQVMQPWLPQVGSIAAADDRDRRTEFAQWLVDADNPYFAKIEANRIWSHLFSRGIVDPIDDFRDSNPPSNVPLLEALAKDFIESGYDRKHLLRTVLGSRTYQASYETNEFNQDDELYFSHQQPRLLSAEQLLDAINHALGLEQKFGNLPDGTLATQLPAPDIVKVDFLKIFGQPERSTVCACERTDDSNLGMAIELFNGPMLHEKLRDTKNRFRAAIAAGRSVEETIRELYLSAVCRPPSPGELQAAIDHCATREDAAAGLEDVSWALFNTDEFLFQH